MAVSTGTPKEKSRLKWDGLLWILPILFLLIFFYFPLGAIFSTAFSQPAVAGIQRISSGSILRPLSFTFGQALLSTLLTLLIGMPAACLFARYEFRSKRFLRILTTLPFIMPTVVVAASFNALLGARGWLNILLMNIFGWQQPPIHILNTFGAVLLAHVFYNTTIMIRVVGSPWEQLDPKFTQAGRVLGASSWRCFQEVTLPLLMPSILSATLLVFLFDFTSFGVILLLGSSGMATLEVEIFKQAMYIFNLRLSAILAIIQLACTLVMTVLISRISGNRSLALMPRLKGENTSKPVKAGEKWFTITMFIVLILLFLTPLLGLAFQSIILIAPNGKPRLTLGNYSALFVNSRNSIFYVPPLQAVLNSLLFAVLTTVIALGLGFLAAYALKQRSAFSRFMEPMMLLPLGASAVTLGLGMIIAFNSPLFNLAAFPLLLPIAHSLVAFPFVLRVLQPTIQSIPQQLRDAAASLGASPGRVWREVDLPILARAAFVSGVFAFTISLGEFGATSFLSRPEFPTIPIAIARFLSLPGTSNYGQAMAMATLLLIICAVAILVMESSQEWLTLDCSQILTGLATNV